eukprot:5822525-Ditylum_brightwellii.AAC.1
MKRRLNQKVNFNLPLLPSSLLVLPTFNMAHPISKTSKTERKRLNFHRLYDESWGGSTYDTGCNNKETRPKQKSSSNKMMKPLRRTSGVSIRSNRKLEKEYCLGISSLSISEMRQRRTKPKVTKLEMKYMSSSPIVSFESAKKSLSIESSTADQTLSTVMTVATSGSGSSTSMTKDRMYSD